MYIHQSRSQLGRNIWLKRKTRNGSFSRTKQLKPEGSFGDRSELVVVQSPLATLLVTVEEERAELVTGR